MDYMSMHDWFYGPPEPTWIIPTYDPAFPRTVYEPALSNRMYAKLEAPETRPARTAYELPDQQLKRMYVKEAESPRSASHYHLYPKAQTAADGPAVRTTREESRRPRIMEDREESGASLHISKEMRKKESQGQLPSTLNPFKNLPIELKVPMCCEKCAKKVYDRIFNLQGVEDVMTDQYNQKVIVTGNVDPSRVLNQVKQVKKHSVFWDQNVEYSQVYLKKKKDRQMAMIQAKQADSSSSSSSCSSSAAAAATTRGGGAKGSSNSRKTQNLDGKLGSPPNSTHGLMIRPEHETRNMSKQFFQSHEDGRGVPLNARGMNLLRESNYPQRTRMMYEAGKEEEHQKRPGGPNVIFPEIPDAMMIQRMPGYESESRKLQHRTQQHYQNPQLQGAYLQELYNAAAAGARVEDWENDDDDDQHFHHHHNRLQPAEYAPAYNPYVRN